MKAVFYEELFKIGWPIGARLVYAQYMFQDYVGMCEHFCGEGGKFDGDFYREFLDDLDQNSWYDVYTPAYKIAKVLNVSRQTVSNCIQTLKGVGVWDDGINILKNVAESPYFYLESDTGLSGWNLIVYSFLVHRCKRYKYVNTNRRRLAETFSIAETHLSHIIAELIKGGWVDKVMNGRYWILIPKRRMKQPNSPNEK